MDEPKNDQKPEKFALTRPEQPKTGVAKKVPEPPPLSLWPGMNLVPQQSEEQEQPKSPVFTTEIQPLQGQPGFLNQACSETKQPSILELYQQQTELAASLFPLSEIEQLPDWAGLLEVKTKQQAKNLQHQKAQQEANQNLQQELQERKSGSVQAFQNAEEQFTAKRTQVLGQVSSFTEEKMDLEQKSQQIQSEFQRIHKMIGQAEQSLFKKLKPK